jgi:uncharacterized protein (DUF58 family)
VAALSLRERFDPRRFIQGEKVREGAVALTHRRIFILPNRRGWGLALLLLLQWLASINYNSNLGFILSFLLGSIALLAALHGFRNMAGLKVSAGRVEPVFAGDMAAFEIILDNSSHAPRIALQIGVNAGLPQCVEMPPQDSLRVKLAVAAPKRGWLDLPTVTVASGFPLGLFRLWSPLRLASRVLVYPQPAPAGAPFPEAPGEGGGRRSSADDFMGFRGYQPGDPPRRIYWKGYAKGQGVHVKEFRGEEAMQLSLDFARTPGANAEARLSQLCRWALEAEQRGLAYGLRLPGADIRPSTGPAHVRRCLEALALFM